MRLCCVHKVVPYRPSGQAEDCFVLKAMMKPWLGHIGDTDVSGGSHRRLGGKRTRTQQAAACSKGKSNSTPASPRRKGGGRSRQD